MPSCIRLGFSGYWKKEGKVKVNETKNSIEFDGFSDPYMPGANFLRCLRNAATKWKLGKDVLRSVVVTNDPLIEYEDQKMLWKCTQKTKATSLIQHLHQEVSGFKDYYFQIGNVLLS